MLSSLSASHPQEKRNEIGRALFEHRDSYRKFIKGNVTARYASDNKYFDEFDYLFLIENPIMEDFMSSIDEIMNLDIESYYDYLLEDILYYNDTEPLEEQFRSNPFTDYLHEILLSMRLQSPAIIPDIEP